MKYKTIGLNLDRDFRNDLNQNFGDIDNDVKVVQNDINAKNNSVNTRVNLVEQESIQRDNTIDGRISSIVSQAGNDNTEIVDARGGAPILRDRLDNVDAQLAQTVHSNNIRISSQNLTLTDNDGYMYWWVSEKDHVYASRYGLQLHKSVDGGKTFFKIHDFPRRIVAVRELDNGELLVGIDYQTDVIPGEDFISSNNQTTFTKVLTHSVNSRLYNAWNVNVHKNLVILGEYGNQGKAQKIWLSQDFGKTFVQIFDIANYASIPSNAHLHGVLYDKYWDRIWLTYGDGIIDVDDNQGGYYSDDMGQTWTRMHVGNQLLNMFALEDSVLFFTDAAPNGVYRYARENKKEQPRLDLVYRTDEENVSITHLCTSIFRKNDREPLIMGFKSTAGGSLPPFVLATYNGVDYFELWRDSVSQSSTTDISFLHIGEQLVGGTTGDTRYTTGTKVTANIKKILNEASPSRSWVRFPFVDVRSLGLIGNGANETRAMLNAFRYAANVKGTLYVPKGMTITVQNMTITGLSDFNILCHGKLKLNSIVSGGTGRTLRMIDCSNVDIIELNTEGNNNTLGALQDALNFVNCSDIRVRTLNSNKVNGNVIRIDGGNRIFVDYIKATSTNTGMNVVLITSGENITFKDIVSDGVGAIGNFGVNTIDLAPASASSVIRNVHFGKVRIKSGGKGGLWAKNIVGATVENITFDDLQLIKTADYSYVVRIEESYIINLVGLKNIKIKGNVFEDKTMDIRGTALFMDNVDGFNINLDVKKVHVAYTIGETGAKNGVLSGETNDIDFDVMRIVNAENAEFRLKVGEYSKATANRYSVTSYGTNKRLKNVKFKGCYFKKPTNSNNNILFFGMTHIDVLVEDNDFNEWRALSDSQRLNVDTAGVVRRNNAGLNYASAKPLLSYWNVGDIIYNSAPAAGGYLGWVCTVAGSPGTWKGFGLIEA